MKDKNYRRNTINPLPGVYRARVEYNKDEQQLGRVKIRIPQCHGMSNEEGSLSYKDLPWAYPCTAFNSGYDYGSLVIPEVGSFVWVLFEAGDPNQPVYIGSMYAKGSSIYQPMGTVDDNDKLNNKYSYSKGRWNRPAFQNEVPAGSYSSEEDYENTKITLYKSPKGATIEIEEKDEKETLSFIDRLGQVIKFMSPVSKASNSYNAYRRYNKRTDEENQYDTEMISLNKKALIAIKDARNQILRFLAKKGSSKIDLISKDEETNSALQLNAGEGTSIMISEYKNNKVYLKLDAKNLSIKLTIESDNSIISEIILNNNIISTTKGEILSESNATSESELITWVDTKDEMDDVFYRED